jgi:RNA polymerase sigma-70 factor (ECF subfamily)
MNTTSLGLLQRLKQSPADESGWRQLHDLYLPLIRTWLAVIPDLKEEEDLVQEIMLVLLRELPSFERRRHGSFRTWLRKITINRIRAYWQERRRRPIAGVPDNWKLLDQLEDSASGLSKQWDEEHDRHISTQLLRMVEPDFEPRTWQAFTRFALEGSSAAQTARELGMTEGAVLQAKFRVLRRLREEAAELLD